MIDAASDELESVDFADRFLPAVIEARINLHMAAGHWDVVGNFARKVLLTDETNLNAWIALGCAVRRTESVTAARDLLLSIEPKLGKDNAIIHYNLACYLCLLGNIAGAKERLATACKMDGNFRAAALDDPDLKAMWDDIATMK
jgi:Flp pilus assembly protein TadD